MTSWTLKALASPVEFKGFSSVLIHCFKPFKRCDCSGKSRFFVFGSLFPYQLTNSELVIEVCGSLSTKKTQRKEKGFVTWGYALNNTEYESATDQPPTQLSLTIMSILRGSKHMPTRRSVPTTNRLPVGCGGSNATTVHRGENPKSSLNLGNFPLKGPYFRK